MKTTWKAWAVIGPRGSRCLFNTRESAEQWIVDGIAHPDIRVNPGDERVVRVLVSVVEARTPQEQQP